MRLIVFEFWRDDFARFDGFDIPAGKRLGVSRAVYLIYIYLLTLNILIQFLQTTDYYSLSYYGSFGGLEMDDDNESQANAYMQDSAQGFGDIQGAQLELISFIT